jgi:hypothetical protein
MRFRLAAIEDPFVKPRRPVRAINTAATTEGEDEFFTRCTAATYREIRLSGDPSSTSATICTAVVG